MNQDKLSNFYVADFIAGEGAGDVPNCIGFYSFRVIERTRYGIVPAMIYGLWVQSIGGRIVFTYDGGDPPSARAGAALALHQAAIARVRADALRLRKHVAFFLDDGGNLAAMRFDRWMKERAPAVLAGAPDLAASGEPYNLAVFGGSLERQPSPPAPPRPAPGC